MHDSFPALVMYVKLQQAFGWEGFRRVFETYLALPDADRPKNGPVSRYRRAVRFALICLLIVCGLDGAVRAEAPLNTEGSNSGWEISPAPAEASVPGFDLGQAGDSEVQIPDSGLRCAVTTALGKALDEAVTQDEMATLKELSSTCEQRIVDLTGLEFAVNLFILKLPDNSISELGPLSGLTDLALLDLFQNSITRLDPLSGLSKLQTLNLGANSISRIEPLRELTSLTWLNLHNNSISDIRSLSGMSNLAWLNLGNNSISQIEPVADLTGLESLDLGSNSVADIEPLAPLVRLRWLYLNNNSISDLEPLSGLVNLVELNLDRNAISDIEPLSGLSDLERLNLYGNAITDIEPLLGLARLMELNLDGNPISEESVDTHLPTLQDAGVNVTWTEAVYLPDPGLRCVITRQLGKPFEEEVTQDEMASITTLGPWARDCEQGIADLRGIEFAENLENLQMRNTAISDIGPLSSLSKLNFLILSPGLVSDLRPLSRLTELEHLWLGGNQISDLRPLSDLSRLTGLYLHRNQISDLRGLSRLTELTRLVLQFNLVSDLGPLSRLRRLQHLDLLSNSVSDLEPLRDITSIETLLLNANSISDVRPLSQLNNLRYLSLSGNSVSDVGPLSRLDSLGTLHLQNNSISDLGPRWRLTRLHTLWLFDNNISNISQLSELTELKTLALRNNSISDIRPVSRLANLGTQGLTNNLISDVEPLSGLHDLRVLWLNNNSISDIAPLSELKNLSTLALSGNSISDIAPLSGLTDLTQLELGDNSIADIEPLSELINLKWLLLSNNLVSNVSPLSVLTDLRELDLSGNAITDIEPLVGLPELVALNLDGNPLNAESIVTYLQVFRKAGVSVTWTREYDTTLNVAWLVPPAADPVRQGFVRLINRSAESGEVFIVPVDDAGRRYDAITLPINAGETIHFNSNDLEDGNVDKGLSAGSGPGEGNWRLHFESDLDTQALTYIRTGDGFLTAMHDAAPVEDNRHRVAIFNPGSNVNQVSRLRLVNPGDAVAEVTISGIDDAGASPGTPVEFEIPAGESLTLTASDLETGAGVEGALGVGTGKWRLEVTSDVPIVSMSLLSSPTGHLTNLSTIPKAPDDENGVHVVPLFPSASDPLGRQGFVRVVNLSTDAGTVHIEPHDDSGFAYEEVSLSIGARATVHFNSNDLELGNAAKGLSGSTGVGVGDWWLSLSSELDIQVLAYIRTTDGFLTSMHEVAPGSEGVHQVAIFNPGSNSEQVSGLRVINPASKDAEVTITGVDDAGASPGSVVVLTVRAEGSRTILATDLESGGEGLRGSLADGVGKWRLRVESDQPILVMSLLSSPTGHLTNLSAAPLRQTAGQ